MKWYHMKGPGGTITCKGSFAQEAARMRIPDLPLEPMENGRLIIGATMAINDRRYDKERR